MSEDRYNRLQSTWAASSENVSSNMRKLRIQIILRMHKILSGPLLSIDTFHSIQ